MLASLVAPLYFHVLKLKNILMKELLKKAMNGKDENIKIEFVN